MLDCDELAVRHFELVRRIARGLASKWGVGDPDAVESAAVYWLLRKSREQQSAGGFECIVRTKLPRHLRWLRNRRRFEPRFDRGRRMYTLVDDPPARPDGDDLLRECGFEPGTAEYHAVALVAFHGRRATRAVTDAFGGKRSRQAAGERFRRLIGRARRGLGLPEAERKRGEN